MTTVHILCVIDFIDIKIMKLILFMSNTTIKCKEKALKKKILLSIDLSG